MTDEEIKEKLENIRDKAEWEGGLDYLLLHHSGPRIFNVDLDLHRKAIKAMKSWYEFQEKLEELYKQYGVEE